MNHHAPANLLSIVVPCFNEADNLQALAQQLRAVLASQPLQIELILIDDGSQDETVAIARSIQQNNPGFDRVRLVVLSRNFGKEAAILAGLERCSGDACVLMDADLQHPPEVLPEMLDRWRAGAELVSAVRRHHSEGKSRRQSMGSKVFYRLFRRLSGLDVTLGASDFRLLDRAVVDAILACQERVRFTKGFFAWAGFRQSEVSYPESSRSEGKSAWGTWKLWNYALDGIFSFSTAPLRIWSYLGGALAIAALIYGASIVVKTLINGADMPGYPSLVSAIVFVGGLQLIGMGILGEYVGRIYIESKRRPVYLVRQDVETQA